MQHRIRRKWLWLYKYSPNNNRTSTMVNRCHWTTFYKQSFVWWPHWHLYCRELAEGSKWQSH